MRRTTENDKGWVISHREKWNHHIFNNYTEAAIWGWLCEMAEWQDFERKVDKINYHLKRGQLITSIKDISDLFEYSLPRTRHLLSKLQAHDMVSKQSTNKATIITIVNYDTYQDITEIKKEVITRKKLAKEQAERKQDASRTQANDELLYNNNTNQPNQSNPLKEDILFAFDEFYKHYPLKKSKQLAIKHWKKLTPEQMQKAIDVVQTEGFKTNMAAAKTERGDFRPHPSSWLNNGCYDDEIVEVEKPKEKMSILDMLNKQEIKDVN